MQASHCQTPASQASVLVQLTFSEKGLRKLMAGVKLFQSALADKTVLSTLQAS